MNDVVETETAEVAAPLKGLAWKINVEVSNLENAVEVASKLIGGLDTAVSIRKTSVELRTILMDAKDACHGLYQETLVVRDGLMGSVAEVQKANVKDALAAKIKEDQAKLAAM